MNNTMGISIPRVAAIHDLSGFGRAALTVVIPILSTMGIQVCPVPTAILSTQGLFKGHSFLDFSASLADYLSHWRHINLCFDAVYSGYIASAGQIEVLDAFIRDAAGQALVVIDPVLGDHGKLYGVTDQALVARMRSYTRLATVITPNLTEAAILLEEPYQAERTEAEVQEWLRRLSGLGPEHVLITSVPLSEGPNRAAVYGYTCQNAHFWRVTYDPIPAAFPGTGDVFTSIVTGGLLQDNSLPLAVVRAVNFLEQAIDHTYKHGTPRREGILLESMLPNLNMPVQISRVESLEGCFEKKKG